MFSGESSSILILHLCILIRLFLKSKEDQIRSISLAFAGGAKDVVPSLSHCVCTITRDRQA